MSSRDLHEQIELLKKNNMIYVIDRPINIDNELAPLCRLQFLGQKESDRKAMLFTNVHNSKGKKYDFPVVVGCVASSFKMQALGMGCEVDEINEKMVRAIQKPIEPIIVQEGKCQEKVQFIDEKNKQGFDLFPIPVATPGWDTAPFLTCSQWITRDPETGKQNVGNYRGHLKSPTRTGIKLMGPQQDIFSHMKKAFERGEKLPVAIVIGGPSALNYAAATKCPLGTSEIAVAGGILGEGIPVVKCKTSDIMVPANAEIVFECELDPNILEKEGPFGEYHGYLHPMSYDLIANLKCVTYRKDAIFQTLQSQCPPTESSIMLSASNNALLNKLLKNDLAIVGVNKAYTYVAEYGSKALTVIQMKNSKNDDTVRALMGAGSFVTYGGKVCIAVDDDIDPTNIEKVFWAVGTRCNPKRDVSIIDGFVTGPLPPYGEFTEDGFCPDHRSDDRNSVLLIDATIKKDEIFTPIALPKKEYMENALKIWDELGFPKIELKKPWYGEKRNEKDWPKSLEILADKAAHGQYWSQEFEDYYVSSRKPLEEYFSFIKKK